MPLPQGCPTYGGDYTYCEKRLAGRRRQPGLVELERRWNEFRIKCVLGLPPLKNLKVAYLHPYHGYL